LLLFGGWWVISANKWFKGPVRMGSDEELEQYEQQLEDSSGMHPEPAGLDCVLGRGRLAAPFPRQPTQAPPFWSIA
jgi:hypothetical protein